MDEGLIMGWTLVIVMLINGASTVYYYGFDNRKDCKSAKSAAESVYKNSDSKQLQIKLQCLENDPD